MPSMESKAGLELMAQIKTHAELKSWTPDWLSHRRVPLCIAIFDQSNEYERL